MYLQRMTKAEWLAKRRESPKAVPPARRSSGFNIPEEVAA